MTNPAVAIRKYFVNSYQELRLVVWPTRKQVITDTTKVVVFTAVVAVFLAVLDIIFNLGLEKILSLK